jgi:hypothetical protein
MPGWRDSILKEFTPQVSRLTIVADPDGLLLEEGILQGIHERGFELIPFDDPIAFRYAYESKYRSRWDKGELTDLVIVLRAESSELSDLPYDLLKAGRKLSFSLADIFPNLSYPVIEKLDRQYLDKLYEVQKRLDPGRMGDNATRDFILSHVFGISPGSINNITDLLKVLLRRHHSGHRIPSDLDVRLIHTLRQSGRFDEWPLETIVPKREEFFAFLQERWSTYLDKVAIKLKSKAQESATDEEIEFSGPLQIPFDHDDIRVYIDNLFAEGLLQPVEHKDSALLSDRWESVGIRIDHDFNLRQKFQKLLKSVEENLPSENARYSDWLIFSHRWAELRTARYLLRESTSQVEYDEKFRDLEKRVDNLFENWLKDRYSGLYNLPGSDSPVMVHHIPRVLSKALEEGENNRVALLVIDGLSLSQWAIIRDKLKTQKPEIRFNEESAFGWLPTLTSISRQSIFAGKPPIYFPGSINTTNKEQQVWQQYWSERGITNSQIGYLRGIKDSNYTVVEEQLNHPKLKVIGIVLNTVDDIMHGMQLGDAGMYNQIHQWVSDGVLIHLLTVLKEKGFKTYITSDHGNIEAQGIGSPSEGSIAESKGQRVRIYSDNSLRQRIHNKFPDAIPWEPIGLPGNYLPLIAPRRKAFVTEGEKIVSHGGNAIGEVIVPFITVSWKKRRNA